MTIEYTYPERPKDAKVDSAMGIYFMRRNEPGEVFLINHIVRDADVPEVPEVCEAMMTLAGHKWPKPCGEDCGCEDLGAWQKTAQRWAAERIIARLKDNSYRTSSEGLSIVELPDALRIVREECGVAE